MGQAIDPWRYLMDDDAVHKRQKEPRCDTGWLWVTELNVMYDWRRPSVIFSPVNLFVSLSVWIVSV